MQENQLQARNVIIEALRIKQAARTIKLTNPMSYDFQKRQFFSTINDFQLQLQMYSYQVLSLNKYINQILERLQSNLAKTKAEFDKIPEVLERMKKFKDKKREQNMKI
jgi:hypothetical protein